MLNGEYDLTRHAVDEMAEDNLAFSYLPVSTLSRYASLHPAFSRFALTPHLADSSCRSKLRAM